MSQFLFATPSDTNNFLPDSTALVCEAGMFNIALGGDAAINIPGVEADLTPGGFIPTAALRLPGVRATLSAAALAQTPTAIINGVQTTLAANSMVPKAAPVLVGAVTSLAVNPLPIILGTKIAMGAGALVPSYLIDANNFTTGNWSTSGANAVTTTSNTVTNTGGYWNLVQDLSLVVGKTYTISATISGVGHSFSWAAGGGASQLYSADNAVSYSFTATTTFNQIAISNAGSSDPGTITVTNFKLIQL